MTARGVRMVLDTSGEALRAGLAGGGIHLVKPSRGELEAFAGRPLPRARPSSKRRMPLSRPIRRAWLPSRWATKARSLSGAKA
jgi:hypothetical protein